MGDEHDSWLESTFGVSVDDLKSKVSDAAQGVAQTVQDTVAPVADTVARTVGDTVQSIEQTVAPAVQAVGQAVENTVQTVQQAVAPVVDAVEQKVDDAVQTVQQAVAPVVDAVEQTSDGADGSVSPEMLQAARSELNAQIEKQTANPDGLIEQLNNLESFYKTDPDPVPTFPPNIDPKTLADDIKEKQYAVTQLDRQRVGICKQARADARQAVEGTKSDLRATVWGGPGTAFAGGVILGLIGIAGGSMALLATLIAGILTEQESYKKLRATLQAIVDKAHSDLTGINTSIAMEKNKLVSMMAAAHMTIPVDDLPNAPN